MCRPTKRITRDEMRSIAEQILPDRRTFLDYAPIWPQVEADLIEAVEGCIDSKPAYDAFSGGDMRFAVIFSTKAELRQEFKPVFEEFDAALGLSRG